MATHEIPCAASSLLADLVDGAEVGLVEVVRTRVSVHYETGDPHVPVLTVCSPEAVRLPNSLVTGTLPSPGATVSLGAGGLRTSGGNWRVRRWWQPPRPVGLPVPTTATLLAVERDLRLPGVPVPRASYDGLSPSTLVGAGPGLTPAGDDVLAGALVAAHATADPRLPLWRATTRTALATTGTTAVSRALLHHALDGYACPELDDFLTALCRDRGISATTTALLAVGHSSGAALIAGVLHTFRTHHLEGAA